jgi:adenine-specific DNA-methyltransferase
LIKYIGSKRLLVPRILAVVRALAPTGTALDLFSGTSRVGHALKRAGYRVVANDHNAYAATLATCYVQADRDRWLPEATRWIAELDRLPGRAGWLTRTYCEESRFFQPPNGARIDAIRDAIPDSLDPELRAILLVSLIEAADRVDSTTGVQMAYLKTWAARSAQPLSLRIPDLLPGTGVALQVDARDAAATPADVAYLDPPYNQHKYLGNYHIWETLVRWDQPEVYGVARKRVDCRTRASDFNSRPRAAAALAAVVDRIAARHLVVSFSDEGYLRRAEIEPLLARRGHLLAFEIDFPRYVGARIGIFNPRGERTGKVSHVRNTEVLYVVSPDADAVARARAALAAVEVSAPVAGRE